MILSPAAFETKWAATLGNFADNTTREISEEDMRDFAQDIKDSLRFGTTTIGNLNLLTQPIGDWDMDTNASPSAWNTGIPIAQFVFATFSVRPDSDVVLQVASELGSSTGLGITIGIAGPNIVITPSRTGGSSFDSTDYNATSFNRGQMVLMYIDP